MKYFVVGLSNGTQKLTLDEAIAALDLSSLEEGGTTLNSLPPVFERFQNAIEEIKELKKERNLPYPIIQIELNTNEIEKIKNFGPSSLIDLKTKQGFPKGLTILNATFYFGDGDSYKFDYANQTPDLKQVKIANHQMQILRKTKQPPQSQTKVVDDSSEESSINEPKKLKSASKITMVPPVEKPDESSAIDKQANKQRKLQRRRRASTDAIFNHLQAHKENRNNYLKKLGIIAAVTVLGVGALYAGIMSLSVLAALGLGCTALYAAKLLYCKWTENPAKKYHLRTNVLSTLVNTILKQQGYDSKDSKFGNQLRQIIEKGCKPEFTKDGKLSTPQRTDYTKCEALTWAYLKLKTFQTEPFEKRKSEKQKIIQEGKVRFRI